MRLIFVELSCLQVKIDNFHVKIDPHDLEKIGQDHPYSNLTKTLLSYIHGISLDPMWLIFVELSCLQAKIDNFHVKIDPRDLEKRSMSSIFELNQDTPEIHPWYKFGSDATNICWVILFTSKNCKFSCWNRPQWPRKIGQGHPSSNLINQDTPELHP